MDFKDLFNENNLFSNFFNEDNSAEENENSLLKDLVNPLILEFIEADDDEFEVIKNIMLKTMKTELNKIAKKSILTNEEKQNEIEKVLLMKEDLIEKINDRIENDLSFTFTPEKKDFIETLFQDMIDYYNSIKEREEVTVSVEKCRENAKIPTYANKNDAGCDVYAVENTTIAAGETKIIPTGLKVAIPSGWMISVRPRSGMSAKTGIRVANAPGTIDTGYRNEVGIILHNTNNEDYTINEGDRIAQFVIEKAPMIVFKEVDNVETIGENRGGGFGSSGK